MSALSLARLLKKNGPLAAILHSLPGLDGSVSIQDVDGTLVWGNTPQPEAERGAVVLREETIGWVTPPALAGLLAYAASQELEKKSLASELLERYRELNLLYRLSEVLGASPHPEAILSAALAEAIRIIPAAGGLILLRPEGQAAREGASPADILQVAALQGETEPPLPGCPLVERVLASGRAELDNGAPGEQYFAGASGQPVSVACAPLKTEQNTLGVILLSGPAERTFTAGELKLLNAIAQQAAPVIEVSRLYQVELEKARYERELQMARQVQESLLPQEMPKIAGWQFERRWHPAHDVSGDFYDVIAEGPQRLGLVISDITDKGMPASLFMVFVRSALRASLSRRGTPERALMNANRVICQDSYQGLFASLFYGRLNTVSGELTYVNAGHPPALFYRRAQDDLQLLIRTGMPLGVDPDTTYTQQTVQLEPGDFMLFYTDGIIEAAGPQHKEFGLERLKDEVFKRRNTSVSELLDGLEQTLADYISPLPVEDDITLMVVKRG